MDSLIPDGDMLLLLIYGAQLWLRLGFSILRNPSVPPGRLLQHLYSRNG
jgi:hypothetical protein